jgi:hypothetical protein
VLTEIQHAGNIPVKRKDSAAGTIETARNKKRQLIWWGHQIATIL